MNQFEPEVTPHLFRWSFEGDINLRLAYRIPLEEGLLPGTTAREAGDDGLEEGMLPGPTAPHEGVAAAVVRGP